MAADQKFGQPPDGTAALTPPSAPTHLTPERWRQVTDAVDSALELAAEARLAFISRACGDDFELRREVERLLDACERAAASQSFLAGPVGEYAAPVVAAVATQAGAAAAAVPVGLAAALAGRYTVERQI